MPILSINKSNSDPQNYGQHHFYGAFNKYSFLLALTFHLLILSAFISASAPEFLKQQVVNIKIISSEISSNGAEKIVQKNRVDQNLAKNHLRQNSPAQNLKSSDAKSVDSVESEAIFDAQYLNNPAPHYPATAKSRGIEGKVLLEVLVSDKGEALNVKIISSSGSHILDESAYETVKNWQFIPAKKFGKFVQASVIVPIEFKII